MGFLDELSRRFSGAGAGAPGFGQSDDPAWLDEIADLAYFHLDLLAVLDLGRVHLVGPRSAAGWRLRWRCAIPRDWRA